MSGSYTVGGARGVNFNSVLWTLGLGIKHEEFISTTFLTLSLQFDSRDILP